MHSYSLYVPDISKLQEYQVRIREILNHRFEGYTMYKAEGAWKGCYEPVRIYNVLTEDRCDHIFDAISDFLKKEAGEESVLYTLDTINTKGI